MNTTSLPHRDEMQRAMLTRDTTYDGVFFTAVRTTRIFCLPSCPARKPLPRNVEYFAHARQALDAGYRPCKRCRPLDPPGDASAEMRKLLAAIDERPTERWTDADLRRMGVDPERVSRWFKKHHGMTFHAYHRARRLGRALGRLRQGNDLTDTAYEHGYGSLSGFRDAFAGLVGEAPGRSRGTQPVLLHRLPTPLGPMLAGATDDGICLLEFADRGGLDSQLERLTRRLGVTPVPGANARIEQLQRELASYFAGTLDRFDVPLISPGTEFQQRVWRALCQIPHGGTCSYAELARTIGRPTAVRAVARANGANRVAILIPCHRVIGADGRLTGYGGGLWRKRRLLELERAPGFTAPGPTTSSASRPA